MKKQLLIIIQLTLGMLLCTGVYAQQVKVTGRVVDRQGLPVAGASVSDKETHRGVVTGSDGQYFISVPSANSVLLYSFMGYDSREETVGSRTVIDVTLEETSLEMEQVIVVGYGAMKKRDLTGSVASIQATELSRIPVSSAAEAIVGKLAGVQVTATEGEPGAEMKIRVRGGGSITQDNSPLYIVDGFPSDLGLDGVDPNDIQSIDVLKDASSTSIYGARGANGVVIITTKGGTEGKFSVSYNGYVGFRKLSKTLPVLNSQDYVLAQWERAVRLSKSAEPNMNDVISLYGEWDEIPGLYGGKPYVDWQEEVFGRSALTQSHNISVSGGTKITKYNFSYTRNDEKGIMLNSGLERDFFKFKFDTRPNDRIGFTANVSYMERTIKGAGTSEADETYSGLINILQYRPVSGKDKDNSELIDDEMDESSDDRYSINPILLTTSTEKVRKQNSLLLNAGVDFTLAKGLVLRIGGGLNVGHSDNSTFYYEQSYQARNKFGGPGGVIDARDTRKWNTSNTLTYANTFGAHHDLTVMLGQEANKYTSKRRTLTGHKFPNSDIGLANMGQAENQAISTDEQAESMLSFFGRVNYSYRSKYLFSASLRRDGSSKFAKDNRYGSFPAASAAWRVSEEDFFRPVTRYIPNLKLRYSYGTSGNNRIGNYLYSTNFSSVYYGVGSVSSLGVKPASLANPSLKWETTTTSNVGVDIGLLKNRVTLSAEFYLNNTKDLLLDADISSVSGYTKQMRNIGSTRSRGMEYVLSASLIDKKDFTWDVNFNISFNKSKVTGLNRDAGWEQDYFITSSGWGYLSGDYIVQVGQPVGSMYGYLTDGIYTADDFEDAAFENGDFSPANLRPGVPYSTTQGKEQNLLGQVKIQRIGDAVDDDGRPVASPEQDRVILGNANPKHFGGLNMTFTYKGFDASIFMNWVYGNDVYNATKLRGTTQMYRNQNTLDVGQRYTMVDPVDGSKVLDRDRLNELNRGVTMPAIAEKAETLTPWVIEDGSFLRINNVTIGYTLPKRITKKMSISKLRVYVTGYNLYTFTNYTGYDPEVDTRRGSAVTPGVDYAAYPRSRQFIAGLNVTF